MSRIVLCLVCSTPLYLIQWLPPQQLYLNVPGLQVARLLDLAEGAAKRWDVTHSDFLSPSVISDAMSSLNALADLKVVAWGGYAQAERVR